MVFTSTAKKPKGPPDEQLAHKLHVSKIIQVIALFINLLICAALAGDINKRDAGLGAPMIVAIIMASVSFALTFLSDWFGRNLHWYESRVYAVFLILFDIVCIGVQMAAVIVLTAAGGLPGKCEGVTTSQWTSNEEPPVSYKEPGFASSEYEGDMDHLCHIPRLSWVISIGLMVAYIHTIGCCIRLIAALGRKRKLQRKVPEVDTEATSPADSTLARPEAVYVADSYEVHPTPPPPPPRPEFASPPPYPHPDDESSVADGIPPMKEEAVTKDRK